MMVNKSLVPPPLGSPQSDQDLVVDPADGVAYLARNGYVNRLTPDFLGIEPGAAPALVPTPVPGESACMFTRGGRFFMLSGYHCCACKGGSNLWVDVADHPLGPWRYLGDIGRNLSTPSPNTSFPCPRTHSPFTFSTRSQASAVFEYGDAHIFLGNQWVTATEPGHPRNGDLFFWSVLRFGADGNPLQVEWSDEMVLPPLKADDGAAHQPPHASNPAAWRQDRFAISMWVDPIVPPAEFDSRYAEIGECSRSLCVFLEASRHRLLSRSKLHRGTRQFLSPGHGRHAGREGRADAACCLREARAQGGHGHLHRRELDAGRPRLRRAALASAMGYAAATLPRPSC